MHSPGATPLDSSAVSASSGSSSTTTTLALVHGRVSAPGVGIWTVDEHERFGVAVATFPTGPWSAIAAYVGTRTVRQTMTHAQKYRERMERHARGLRPAGRRRRHGTDPSTTTSLLSIAPLTTMLVPCSDQPEPESPVDPADFDWVFAYLPPVAELGIDAFGVDP